MRLGCVGDSSSVNGGLMDVKGLSRGRGEEGGDGLAMVAVWRWLEPPRIIFWINSVLIL